MIMQQGGYPASQYYTQPQQQQQQFVQQPTFVYQQQQQYTQQYVTPQYVTPQYVTPQYVTPQYGQGGVTTVVVGTSPIANPNYRHEDLTCLSVLVCLFCFWPIGCCAIFSACEANNLYANKNYTAAQAATIRTKRYIRASVIVAIVIIVISILSSTA